MPGADMGLHFPRVVDELGFFSSTALKKDSGPVDAYSWTGPGPPWRVGVRKFQGAMFDELRLHRASRRRTHPPHEATP